MRPLILEYLSAHPFTYSSIVGGLGKAPLSWALQHIQVGSSEEGSQKKGYVISPVRGSSTAVAGLCKASPLATALLYSRSQKVGI